MSDPSLEEDNLISQDELDKLLASPSTDAAEKKGSSDDDDSLDALGTLSQEDMDLFSNSDVSGGKDLLEGEDLDAEDVELISQDDIDSLMNAPDDEEFEMLSPEDLDTLIAGETADTKIEGDTVDDTLQDDLLIETEILDEADPGVRQENINALLFESEDDKEQTDDEDEDDEDEEEEDILISQDDIDTLLMAADQEEEDVLGDLMDNAGDDSLDDDVVDEDILENEYFDADETADEIADDTVDDTVDETHQVVLEEADGEPAVPPLGGKTSAGSGWYRSKLVIACASVLIVLGITVPVAYFFFLPGESAEKRQPETALQFAVQGQKEIELATVEISTKPQGHVNKPGNMILTDFIILSSDQSNDMAYITADISIDYSDQSVYHEIQNNLSLYRDLIYDSLNKSLVFEKRERMTEADLLLSVENTLKKVLPGAAIARVSFKSFRAS